MANKCEVLSEARAQVAKNGIVRRYYCHNGCYCAVGYVLKGLGLSDYDLESLGDSQIDDIYHQGMLQTSLSSIKVREAINDSGIGIDILRRLQKANDNVGDAVFVVAKFDEVLVEANCQ